MTTIVVFRKWKDRKDIIALFPRIPADISGYMCLSYMHIGQHGDADPARVVSQTVLAKPDEYAGLLKELKSIGYRGIEVHARLTYADQQYRMALAKKQWGKK